VLEDNQWYCADMLCHSSWLSDYNNAVAVVSYATTMIASWLHSWQRPLQRYATMMIASWLHSWQQPLQCYATMMIASWLHSWQQPLCRCSLHSSTGCLLTLGHAIGFGVRPASPASTRETAIDYGMTHLEGRHCSGEGDPD